MKKQSSSNVTVGIATAGRPSIVSDTLVRLVSQTVQPHEILLCPAVEGDVEVEKIFELVQGIRVVTGEPGLTKQRNTLIAECRSEILLFFDDDFIPADDFVEQVECVFEENTDVAMVTGSVVADGILGPGLTIGYAVKLLNRKAKLSRNTLSEIYNGYGCNFAIRLKIVLENELEFDENLPAYGWLEDVDFSRQLAPFGRVVRSGNLLGVHLGTKSGRMGGTRLGYSQIANPVYLYRKGTMSFKKAAYMITRNCAANLLKLVSAEKYVDRRGRLLGNTLAVRDFLSGVLSPNRIDQL